MNYENLSPIIRTMMNTFALYLVASGLIDEGMVDALVGLGVNGVAVLWFITDKWCKARALKKRRDARKGGSVADMEAALPTLPEVIKANP